MEFREDCLFFRGLDGYELRDGWDLGWTEVLCSGFFLFHGAFLHGGFAHSLFLWNSW